MTKLEKKNLMTFYETKHIFTFLTQLFSIYPREIKTYVHKNTCTNIFIATYSQESKPENSWYFHQRIMDKEIIVCSHNETLHSSNKLLVYTTIWTNLKNTLLNEKSSKPKVYTV